MLIPQTFLVGLCHTKPRCIRADLCGAAHAGESHMCLPRGRSVRTPPRHAVPDSCLHWRDQTKKVCEHINVNHTDVILATRYFYWPIKNKIAMWATRHEFWWWALKPIAKLCYLQCLSNPTAVIKRLKKVSPAHVPIPFPLPGGKAGTSSSRCTAVFLAISRDIACRFQQWAEENDTCLLPCPSSWDQLQGCYNNQVSLDSPPGTTTVCHFVTTPELRSGSTTFHSLLTRVVFMAPTLKWETARCLGTLRSALSARTSLFKERYV